MGDEDGFLYRGMDEGCVKEYRENGEGLEKYVYRVTDNFTRMGVTTIVQDKY